MTHRLAARIDSDPVGVRVVDFLPAGMGVSTRNHIHIHRTTAGQQLAKGVAIAEPGAALLQWNLRGVERHYSACAQAGRVGMNAAEVIEPKLLVVIAGIVLDERKLRPAHGPVIPASCAGCRLCRFSRFACRVDALCRTGRKKTSCCGKCRCFYEFTTATHVWTLA